MLSLTAADFVAVLPFSNKIEEAKVRPFVQDALTLDLVPLLGWAVLEAVQALPADAAPTPYAPGLSATAQQLVQRQERVYQALASGVSSTTIPTDGTSTGAWAYQPLLTLWLAYLKPYWLRAAWARMTPTHGMDNTKAGMVKPTDREGTFQPVSSAERAEVVTAAESVAAALRNRLAAFLAAETRAYRADSTTGYNYGPAIASCSGLSTTRRSGLRGINNPRR